MQLKRLFFNSIFSKKNRSKKLKNLILEADFLLCCFMDDFRRRDVFHKVRLLIFWLTRFFMRRSFNSIIE